VQCVPSPQKSRLSMRDVAPGTAELCQLGFDSALAPSVRPLRFPVGLRLEVTALSFHRLPSLIRGFAQRSMRARPGRLSGPPPLFFLVLVLINSWRVKHVERAVGPGDLFLRSLYPLD